MTRLDSRTLGRIRTGLTLAAFALIGILYLVMHGR